MDSKLKLKRFCFLGSFEPVYTHLRGSLKVDTYWPIVENLVKDINDTEFLPLIREILHEVSLVRRDEVSLRSFMCCMNILGNFSLNVFIVRFRNNSLIEIFYRDIIVLSNR